MSTSFFHNQNNTLSRRQFVTGVCAMAGAQLLPTGTLAMTSRAHRPFVDLQVEHACSIILEERFDEALSNRYLASALYYSEQFLNRVAQSAHQVDVPSMIIGRIVPSLSLDFRRGVFEHFNRLTNDDATVSQQQHLPLRRFSFGHGPNHVDAVDLFVAEGTAIHAHTAGLVLLADSSWRHGDPQSAASLRGGNTVVIFNPERSDLCRYAHLRTVEVTTGQIVPAGSRIGTVGNTGTNARLPGHGGHLHFEINQHHQRNRINTIVTASEIRRRLQSLL
jgi:murein DD-endopeptidase MepM/ murein hydrolase activator NlpD